MIKDAQMLYQCTSKNNAWNIKISYEAQSQNNINHNLMFVKYFSILAMAKL